ncbi:Hypothetical protein PP7435_CHR1-1492 [Komagataella phaffii CBS 7435]|uniref:Uncharacterized protein n=2 Tax=Komagataella phaffii TaxID=460519 RepID=C4QZ70_KOMPG|nr:uncharacterized protein PAS_FragB_0072 [Komagataella phaffii GS115]AOA60661.1 GQ67_01453T0 [Komagataella phaffii]CAH2447372.1 Hypothetical protein BQ9382_C1-7800 [Komagataella phaffii CBS 7435]AOA66206.1 GQ68_01469T0 [Komagataella phaffii GS115]CAY68544.1 hypothetical protein PAS_FragB_0072 [Komagataella phaffii GS115]CCA37605.1 Hypothetical protein PP7435_CHR1-1492 [Komagataella phaffii CBS 7435]
MNVSSTARSSGLTVPQQDLLSPFRHTRNGSEPLIAIPESRTPKAKISGESTPERYSHSASSSFTNPIASLTRKHKQTPSFTSLGKLGSDTPQSLVESFYKDGDQEVEEARTESPGGGVFEDSDKLPSRSNVDMNIFEQLTLTEDGDGKFEEVDDYMLQTVRKLEFDLIKSLKYQIFKADEEKTMLMQAIDEKLHQLTRLNKELLIVKESLKSEMRTLEENTVPRLTKSVQRGEQDTDSSTKLSNLQEVIEGYKNVLNEQKTVVQEVALRTQVMEQVKIVETEFKSKRDSVLCVVFAMVALILLAKLLYIYQYPH